MCALKKRAKKSLKKKDLFFQSSGVVVMVVSPNVNHRKAILLYTEFFMFRYYSSCFSAPVASTAQHFAASPWAFKPLTTVNHNYKGSHPSESLGWIASSGVYVKRPDNCCLNAGASVANTAKLRNTSRAKSSNYKGQTEEHCIRKVDPHQDWLRHLMGNLHSNLWPQKSPSSWLNISCNIN